MEKRELRCDGCSCDLNTLAADEESRFGILLMSIHLGNGQYWLPGGKRYGPLTPKDECHFCSMECLSKWSAEQVGR